MQDLEAACKAKGLKWVGSSGPLDAKIFICGEAPGVEEVRLGQPFVGGAGHLLTAVLSQAQISRETCYITNVCKVSPPKNDLKLLGTLGLSIKEFIPLLKEELERVRPNVVLALGSVALSALCSLPSIMSYRGSILESTLVPGIKVIPSVHPAAILRQYKWRPLLLIDCKKVKRESERKEIKLAERRFLIEPSFSDAVSVLKEIMEGDKRVAFDIEVDLEGIISCLGLSPMPEFAICIPFRNGYRNYWSEGEEYSIWKMLKRLFELPKEFIAQNALFDMRWLVPKVGYFDVWMDTMWAHQLLYAEIPKGLDTLASIYTNEPYYKDERKVWKDVSLTRQLWDYNCKDAVITMEVALKLEQELKEQRQEEFFFGFLMRMIPVLLKLELRGIKVDLGAREEVRKELEEREKELEKLIPVNVRSPKQMKEFLYGQLGLPEQYDHKKGNISTGKDAIKKLRRKLVEREVSKDDKERL